MVSVHAPVQNKEELWRPSAHIDQLRKRALILQKIRDFFSVRNILEVETPLLCQTSVTDPFIQSIQAIVKTSTNAMSYYLQTSPEYAMKRLLAAGSGDIFQICKAFRQDELGQLHNPEFSIIEWYRLSFTLHDLMNEVDELLQLILETKPSFKKNYTALFEEFLKIDPHHATVSELKNCASKNNISIASPITDRDTWLQLLMLHCIEPKLGLDRPCFIYHFPASQAALARIQDGVAARFEVYYKGMELANGFHELKDSNEQRTRFNENLEKRKELGFSSLPIDELFLSALEFGLPDCAGVALGLDRLVMLATNSDKIADILSFDFSRV